MIDINDLEDIQLANVDPRDYPDFVDAYIYAADYDGKPMTDEQLDYLHDAHSDFVNEQVYDSIF